MTTMFDAALRWLNLGAELLPCQPASKRLVAGFGPHMQHITTADGARAWFAERRCNLALVCGLGFTVLDFDDAGLYSVWAAGNPEAAATYTEQTRRGFHAFFSGVGRILGIPEGAEVKQTGGMVLLSPSTVGGFVYHPVKLGAVIQPLKVGFSLLSESMEPARAVVKRAEVGGDTLSRVKSAWNTLELAQSVTVLRASTGGRWYRGACPLADHGANHDGRQPFWVDAEHGMWGCYACGVRGDVVNLYAAIYRVSVREAIAAMAAQV